MKQEIAGYETQERTSGCKGCAFISASGCDERACCAGERTDNREVIFVRKRKDIMNPAFAAPYGQPKLKIYIIGSLRNDRIPVIAEDLRKQGYDVFDAWYSAGPEADDYWQKHEKLKGNNFQQALAGDAAQNVYNFDKKHLDAADAVVMVMPAGKSGHLELGYCAGKGKRTYILMDGEPERYDVMYNFATKVVLSMEELQKELAT